MGYVISESVLLGQKPSESVKDLVVRTNGREVESVVRLEGGWLEVEWSD